MYVATEWFPGLFVTDAGADTVVRWLELGRVVRFMCSDPDRNRLWCASDSEVVAIDCASDSVVARIPAPWIATDLCLSRPAGKLYYASMPDSCVVVYDCDGDTIRAWVRLDSMPWRLAADPGSGMVYVGLYRGRSVKVMDPVGDSVITTIPVNVAGMSCLYLSTQTNKLYCFGDGGALVVVDLANDSVLRRLTIGGQAGAACLNPVAAKLYAANYENTVSIIDATRDSLLITLSGWDQPSDLVCDTVADKVYCACSGSGDIGVIDGATNRRIRTIPVGAKPNALVINQARQRVYATNSGGSSVAVVSESAPGPGIEEVAAPGVRKRQPTVVRGVLFLPETSSNKLQAAGWLLDVSGRKALALRPGPNDIRHLAPGVYFVREASGVKREASSVTKVVVTR
jgi:YVTN family beta-propeller protein